MNYYNQIKENLINNEVYKKVKDYSKSKSDLNTYYNVGKLLHEAGKHYGEGIIKEYSIKLTIEIGRQYTTSLLYKMKQFYNIIEKVPTMSGKLTWSHWYEMLSVKDIEKIKYYVYQCEDKNLSVRQLRLKIKNKEYERLPAYTKEKLLNQKEMTLKDIIPNK